MGINRERLGLGMLVIGAPGAGKTNFINANLKRILETMESDDVIIVFDTKGDYLTEFGGMIADRDKIVIGTGEEYRNETSYHNILQRSCHGEWMGDLCTLWIQTRMLWIFLPSYSVKWIVKSSRYFLPWRDRFCSSSCVLYEDILENRSIKIE